MYENVLQKKKKGLIANKWHVDYLGAFDALVDSSKYAQCNRNISAVFGRQRVFNFFTAISVW